MLLVVSIRHQQKKNIDKINAVLTKSNRQLMRYTFASQEIMARMVSRLCLDKNRDLYSDEDPDSDLDEIPDEAVTTSDQRLRQDEGKAH